MNPAINDRSTDPEPPNTIILRGVAAMLTRNHTDDSKPLVRHLVVHGLADGSGQLIFHDGAANVNFAPTGACDPDHETATVRLDPRQFAAFLDGAMRPVDASEMRR